MKDYITRKERISKKPILNSYKRLIRAIKIGMIQDTLCVIGIMILIVSLAIAL